MFPVSVFQSDDFRASVRFLSLHLAIVAGYFSLVYDLGLIDPIHLDETLRLYLGYADQARAGRIPYRDYPLEYPLAAFPLFFLPRLLTPPLDYPFAFAAEMMTFDAATIALIARHARREGGPRWATSCLIWYTLYFAALGPLAIARYDLAPMAVAFAAACWWSSGRPVAGGVATGIGLLMKVFPGAIAVPALVRDVSRPRGERGLGLLALTITTGMLALMWIALGRGGVADSLRYHARRGLEVESLYAGLVLLYGNLTGARIECEATYGAWHIPEAWGAPLAALAVPAQVAALLFVGWRSRRSGMADGLRYAGAAVLAFILFGKVLSAQFPIWLFPFIAVQGGRIGRIARPLFLACCILTAVLYPWGGLAHVLNCEGWAIAILNARNGLLLGLLALLLTNPEDASRGESPAAPGLCTSPTPASRVQGMPRAPRSPPR